MEPGCPGDADSPRRWTLPDLLPAGRRVCSARGLIPSATPESARVRLGLMTIWGISPSPPLTMHDDQEDPYTQSVENWDMWHLSIDVRWGASLKCVILFRYCVSVGRQRSGPDLSAAYENENRCSGLLSPSRSWSAAMNSSIH